MNETLSTSQLSYNFGGRPLGRGHSVKASLLLCPHFHMSMSPEVDLCIVHRSLSRFCANVLLAGEVEWGGHVVPGGGSPATLCNVAGRCRATPGAMFCLHLHLPLTRGQHGSKASSPDHVRQSTCHRLTFI